MQIVPMKNTGLSDVAQYPSSSMSRSCGLEQGYRLRKDFFRLNPSYVQRTRNLDVPAAPSSRATAGPGGQQGAQQLISRSGISSR